MIAMKLECKTCPFWQCMEGEEVDQEVGECRKALPVVGNFDDAGSRWPVTLDSEWCFWHPEFSKAYEQWRKDNAEQLCRNP